MTAKALNVGVGYFEIDPAPTQRMSWRDRKNQTVRKPSMESPLPTTERECLTCKKPFKSSGANNRMCTNCRHLSASPFEPNG